VFWGRLPLVASAFALAWLIPAAAAKGSRGAFDWTGALLLVGWLSAFLLAAAQPEIPHAEVVTVALIALGALALWAFLAHEARHRDPIIRPSLFRDQSFLVVNLASVVVNLAGFSVMLLVPFHLARTAGLTAGIGGLVLGANASGVVLGSWAAGRLSARFGHTPLALAGAGISVAGLALVATWTRASPPMLMALCLVTQGLGLGLFQVAYSDRVLATLPQSDRGVAGSLTLVTRTLGIIGAAAGLSALKRHLEAAAAAAGVAEPALAAFQETFALVAGGLAIGLALVLMGMAVRARTRPA
jgi:predicted MFS family arabinose efflux permease